MVVEDNDIKDKQKKHDDQSERSSNEDDIHALLTVYQNVGDKFKIDDMEPYDKVNESNLTHVIVSMVMIQDKKESGVLINSDIQQI